MASEAPKPSFMMVVLGLRDARGHESSISCKTGYLQDVQPGDPLHKSPGNEEIRPRGRRAGRLSVLR